MNFSYRVTSSLTALENVAALSVRVAAALFFIFDPFVVGRAFDRLRATLALHCHVVTFFFLRSFL